MRLPQVALCQCSSRSDSFIWPPNVLINVCKFLAQFKDINYNGNNQNYNKKNNRNNNKNKEEDKEKKK